MAQTVKDTRCKIHPHHGMMAFQHSEPARGGQRTEHQFRELARLSFGHPEKPRSTPEEWRQSAPGGRRL
ncbi:hypothetical protein NBH07_21450 [Parabacteroides sp. B2-S-102]|uniref:hypothetical protein n=1 Tax=Parabacteroides sp. B2-S-102 TaxID=2949657 RepID=UPI0020308BC6|nr:hypothetical protein [Parabacteroides sp. B2-S-102]MCM0697455.1 hypothetical protein [Parabacteroides sp. B2-S-102]